MRNGHARSADIGFTLRATDCSTHYGPDEDKCLFAKGIPVGGGSHGGLNKGELSTVLAAQGPAFRAEFVSQAPCWLPDIAPTILTVMGLPLGGCEGRALTEALTGDGPEFGIEPVYSSRLLQAEINGHEQYLRQWIVGDRTIVDCGWTAGRGAWDS